MENKSKNNKVKVDENKCIGCGSCCYLCPKVFELLNGKAKVINNKIDSPKLKNEVEKAKKSCPVGAISFDEK